MMYFNDSFEDSNGLICLLGNSCVRACARVCVCFRRDFRKCLTLGILLMELLLRGSLVGSHDWF